MAGIELGPGSQTTWTGFEVTRVPWITAEAVTVSVPGVFPV